MIPVQVRLTKKIVEEIDRILEKGIHVNRSDFIRDAIRRHIEVHSNGNTNGQGLQLQAPHPAPVQDDVEAETP